MGIEVPKSIFVLADNRIQTYDIFFKKSDSIYTLLIQKKNRLKPFLAPKCRVVPENPISVFLLDMRIKQHCLLCQHLRQQRELLVHLGAEHLNPGKKR